MLYARRSSNDFRCESSWATSCAGAATAGSGCPYSPDTQPDSRILVPSISVTGGVEAGDVVDRPTQERARRRLASIRNFEARNSSRRRCKSMACSHRRRRRGRPIALLGSHSRARPINLALHQRRHVDKGTRAAMSQRSPIASFVIPQVR